MDSDSDVDAGSWRRGWRNLNFGESAFDFGHHDMTLLQQQCDSPSDKRSHDLRGLHWPVVQCPAPTPLGPCPRRPPGLL